MLDGHHDFSFFHSEKLFKSIKFKPVLDLLIYVKPLKDGAAVILEAKAYVFTESVIPNNKKVIFKEYTNQGFS